MVGEDVEVVVAGLPEVLVIAFEEFGGFALEDSHRVAESLASGFGEQEVDVLGHEDVAEEVELVGESGALEDLFEDETGVVIIEERGALVTTEGDEVIVAAGLVALQMTGHEGIVVPGTLYPTHPRRTRMNGAPSLLMVFRSRRWFLVYPCK